MIAAIIIVGLAFLWLLRETEGLAIGLMGKPSLDRIMMSAIGFVFMAVGFAMFGDVYPMPFQELRETALFSRRGLSELLKVRKRYIELYERGKREAIPDKELDKIVTWECS